jgi:hypothetical protein
MQTSDIKNPTNMNIDIFQKIEDCEGGGGSLICRVVFYSSKYGIHTIQIKSDLMFAEHSFRKAVV